MRRIAMTVRAIPALAAAVVGTAIAVPHATAHPAPTQSVTTNGSSPQYVTLLWIDAETGQTTSNWTGSPAEAAILRDAPYPTSNGATTQPDQQSGTISPLTSRVYNCTDPNPYWDVRNYPPLVCFAYAGDINVNIGSVYEVDSGNNSGYFKYYYGGYYHQISLSRWTSAIFYSKVTVTHIHIY